MENFLLPVLISVGVSIILIFVFFSNRDNARKKKQKQEFRAAIRKNGVLASGIIISSKRVGETHISGGGKSGISSVENIIITYDVDVQPDGQPAFKATFTDEVNKYAFPNYSLGGGESEDVGRKLWVRYNPNDPSQMIFEYYDSDRRQILGRAKYNKLEARNKVLRETGEEAVAVILETEDLDLLTRFEKDFNIPLGTFTGFKLEVTSKDGSIFQAETQAQIHPKSLGKYAAGRKIYVKFDPRDRSQVSILRSLD